MGKLKNIFFKKFPKGGVKKQTKKSQSQYRNFETQGKGVDVSKMSEFWTTLRPHSKRKNKNT